MDILRIRDTCAKGKLSISATQIKERLMVSSITGSRCCISILMFSSSVLVTRWSFVKLYTNNLINRRYSTCKHFLPNIFTLDMFIMINCTLSRLLNGWDVPSTDKKIEYKPIRVPTVYSIKKVRWKNSNM